MSFAEHHVPGVLKSLPEQPSPQQKNLADEPDHATTRAAMESLFEQMIQHDDPYRFSDQPTKEQWIPRISAPFVSQYAWQPSCAPGIAETVQISFCF